MNWLPQWLLMNIGFLVVFIVVARLLWRANKRKVEELADRLKPEASTRGWQVSTELRSNNVRVIRWSGREFDIQWIGEDLYRKRGQRPHNQVMEVTRWHTVDRRGPAGTIFLMGVPEGTQLPKVQEVNGVFESLALKAAFFALDKGLDLYFGDEVGKEIDASTLERVEEVEPLLKGYAVFAERTHEAADVIRNGVHKAIAETIDAGLESMQGYRRPWILIWKRGVVIARMGATRTAAELEPVVRAGIAITRAASRF
jgi:hypothetical protein